LNHSANPAYPLVSLRSARCRQQAVVALLAALAWGHNLEGVAPQCVRHICHHRPRVHVDHAWASEEEETERTKEMNQNKRNGPKQTNQSRTEQKKKERKNAKKEQTEQNKNAEMNIH
jgi:hypothetical protein